MTGDGVNDAPALREAHVGVCMGLSGTEVTREASDVVLADDNYTSIVAAVREGRGIFDNIRKAIVYLLSGNAAELLVMVLAAVFGLPTPLLPLQMLWVNIVTDGLPALALVMDTPEADVMHRPPRRPDEPMLGRREWLLVGAVGALESVLSLAVFVWALSHRSEVEARSLMFAVMVMIQVLMVFAARSPRLVFWQVGPLSNRLLLVVVALSLAGQYALHHFQATQRLFRVAPLSTGDWALVVAVGVLAVTAAETAKVLARRGLSTQVPKQVL